VRVPQVPEGAGMIPDDTVLTYGELKRWFALYGSDLARADAHHTIILGILAMREPAGTGAAWIIRPGRPSGPLRPILTRFPCGP
jgi:hypothetical protein